MRAKASFIFCPKLWYLRPRQQSTQKRHAELRSFEKRVLSQSTLLSNHWSVTVQCWTIASIKQ